MVREETIHHVISEKGIEAGRCSSMLYLQQTHQNSGVNTPKEVNPCSDGLIWGPFGEGRHLNQSKTKMRNLYPSLFYLSFCLPRACIRAWHPFKGDMPRIVSNALFR